MARRRRCPRPAGARRYAGMVALPRKFLNDDEELLAELRPHWIFLFGPLFTSIGVWAALIVIVVLWHNAPSWMNYPILILALIPGLWLLGRYVRWRSYVVALTSTRILVRQGILGRNTVQLRLQRITEVNIRQTLVERVLGTGSLHHRRAGRGRFADPGVHAQAGRRPARHQLADQRDRGRAVGARQIPASCSRGTGYGAPYADGETDAATAATRRRRYDDGTRRRRAPTRPPSVVTGMELDDLRRGILPRRSSPPRRGALTHLTPDAAPPTPAPRRLHRLRDTASRSSMWSSTTWAPSRGILVRGRSSPLETEEQRASSDRHLMGSTRHRASA